MRVQRFFTIWNATTLRERRLVFYVCIYWIIIKILCIDVLDVNIMESNFFSLVKLLVKDVMMQGLTLERQRDFSHKICSFFWTRVDMWVIGMRMHETIKIFSATALLLGVILPF